MFCIWTHPPVIQKMAFPYEVTIHMKDSWSFSMYRSLYVTLVGKQAESEKAKTSTPFYPFNKNVFKITVNCPEDIGEVLMIKIDGYSNGLIPYTWHPEKVEMKSPSGLVYMFCGYQWISGNNVYLFKEETALLSTNSELLKVCSEEIEERRKIYCWSTYKSKWPDCIDADSAASLHLGQGYLITRILKRELKVLLTVGWLELTKSRNIDNFTDMSQIKDLHKHHMTPTSEYIMNHWKEDDFFGRQFLNGVNPMVIKRIKALPGNFPVTDEMVSLKLSSEMQKGNIFLCDYKILDGVRTNTINEKKQYLAAPLVLLHRDANEMKPIAIQLKQKPGEDNPIFLPTDFEFDWLLAKAFVRSAEFNLHEIDYHLLRTHLLAEVFIVSLNRNLPGVHPIYKLLVRHTFDTLQINNAARTLLVSDNGVLTKNSAAGKDGINTIVQRALQSVTYASLCFPDDIKERDLEDVPNFYYRDDGRKLWDCMHQFVNDILGLYYKNDDLVKNDKELQNWIKETFQHGCFDQEKSGIPKEIISLVDLVKFVTMVMFTCSAQHAAVNFGQYDFYGWMPNCPATMQVAPPIEKGKITEAQFLNALPDYKTAVQSMETVLVLSAPTPDERYLPDFDLKDFTEDAPRQKIVLFKQNLAEISNIIQTANRKLPFTYPYLDPKHVENSISI
ncbi:polyunsaturated fatty acid lipoxygenase ALOX15B-like isoform X2 [Oryzias latipes]